MMKAEQARQIACGKRERGRRKLVDELLAEAAEGIEQAVRDGQYTHDFAVIDPWGEREHSLSIARAVARALFEEGYDTQVVDVPATFAWCHLWGKPAYVVEVVWIGTFTLGSGEEIVTARFVSSEVEAAAAPSL